MPGDTVVMVRAGTVVFAVLTSFARLPVPGEHVMLALNDAQRAQLGPEFGYGRSREYVPAVVRETILRQKDHWRMNLPNTWSRSDTVAEHIADVFVEALSTGAWNAKMAAWGAG